MLTIRLTRKGKKNQPFFRVVVTDKRRSSKGGRAVEDLGYVDPLTKRKSLKKERILYWISKGAKPSASMHNLLITEKVIDAKKIHVSKLSKKKQAEISTAAKAKVDEDATKKAEAEKAVESKAETAAPVQTPSTPEENPAETPAEPAKEEKPAEPEPAEEAKTVEESKTVEAAKSEEPKAQ